MWYLMIHNLTCTSSLKFGLRSGLSNSHQTMNIPNVFVKITINIDNRYTHSNNLDEFQGFNQSEWQIILEINITHASHLLAWGVLGRIFPRLFSWKKTKRDNIKPIHTCSGHNNNEHFLFQMWRVYPMPAYHLSIHLSIYVSIYLSINLSVPPYFHPSIIC